MQPAARHPLPGWCLGGCLRSEEGAQHTRQAGGMSHAQSLCRRCPRQPLHFSSAAGDAPGPCWGTHSLRSSIRSHFPHTQHRGAPVSLQGCTQMCQRAPGIGVGVFGGSCCAGGRRSAVCGPVRTGARACLSLRPRCRSALSAGAPQLQQRACCVRCASPGSSCWTLAGACEGQ